MKIKAIQTDKKKSYCKYCGTWTINKRGCININHNYYQKKNAKKFKSEGDNDE
jgi:competence CoiA-like predicted nuclease